MKKLLLALGCWGMVYICFCSASIAQQHDLPSYFSADNLSLPTISGHRGGRFYQGLPENSLAVFQYVTGETNAYIECDVTMSADSVLYLMHDDDLDRTTTGTGLATERSWSYLDSLYLVDDFGTVTSEMIPTLEETMEWAKDKTILSLDLKEVPEAYLVKFLDERQSQNDVVLIAYNLEQALELHRLAPEYVLSVSIRSMEELTAIENAGIPLDQLLAFTGTSLPSRELIDAIHAKNIPTILGTMGDQDPRFRNGEENPYREAIERGIMILATDHPVEAAVRISVFRD